MRLILLSIVFSIIASLYLKCYDTPMEEHLFNISYGLYYDNTNNVNKFLKDNNLPIFNQNHVNFIGINYSTNQYHFLFDEAKHFFYSISLKLPFTRYIRENNYENNFQTYSLFFETFIFESYLKKITIRPILGFGLSQTNLTIRQTNGNFVDLKDLGIKSNTAITFTKFTVLFNIGGGCAFRYKLIDDAIKTKNLVVGFNIRYSIPLDILNLYNAGWKSGNSIVDIPDYYAPDLSLDFYLGIEVQKKILEMK